MRVFARDDTTTRARAAWAVAIARLVDELERPESLLRAATRLYRRDVAAACAPSLIEIRRVLVDDAAAVRPEAMRRLRAFMTDGARSLLYRDEPEHARRAARELAVAFTFFAGTRPATGSVPAERVASRA
jgi:hypothetical protein